MKQLQKYNHPPPKKPQHCPWEPAPRTIGTKSQETEPEDTSPPLDKKGIHRIHRIQQICGSFLFYGRANDPTIAHALNELASQQSCATEQTTNRANQFLDYMHTHPDVVIRYYASDMILIVHSDAS